MDTTRLDVGPLNARLEGAITTGLDEAIDEVARDLAGGVPKVKGFRSKAVRHLLILGARAYAKEKAKR